MYKELIEQEDLDAQVELEPNFGKPLSYSAHWTMVKLIYIQSLLVPCWRA